MCVDKHIILYYIHRYIDRFQRVSGCEEYMYFCRYFLRQRSQLQYLCLPSRRQFSRQKTTSFLSMTFTFGP